MKRLIMLITFMLLYACGNSQNKAEKVENQSNQLDSLKNKGIGPIKEIKLSENIDENLAMKGEDIFKTKCSACHKIRERYVGPAIEGITKRRTPEWIMNMMLNTEEMLQKDPIAKKLLSEYITQMSVQVSEEEARAILEYFRKVDKTGGKP